MDHARKKIWVCLLCVVAAAVIVGVCYYFTDVRQTELSGEGTLVRLERSEKDGRWQRQTENYI
jgi:putative exporter of polyketide antibiotics|nr:hypothetical protein [uncultured Faecalimonas sp.]